MLLILNYFHCLSIYHLIVHLFVYTFSSLFVEGRGVAIFGGKNPVPNSSVVKKLDTGRHIIWAVFGFASVVLIFLSICFCRCYYRYKEMTSANKPRRLKGHHNYLNANYHRPLDPRLFQNSA